jgi:hypothetical protein
MKAKKVLLLSVGLVFLVGSILTGCGQQEQASEPKATAAEQKTVSNETQTAAKPKEDSKIVVNEDGSKQEGLKTKEVNKVVKVSPVNITIKSMAIVKLSNISDGQQEFLSQYTFDGKKPKEITYLEVNYEAENTSDKNIQWNGISKIVLDNGEQLDAQKDFLWENEDSDVTYYGKVKKEGAVGLIIKGKPEDIHKAKFIMGSTANPDTYDEITGEQQAEFNF